MVRGLTFRLRGVEGLYHLSSENKGVSHDAAQLVAITGTYTVSVVLRTNFVHKSRTKLNVTNFMTELVVVYQYSGPVVRN